MLLLFLVGSALCATQNEKRPIEKKIAHLKKAAPEMVQMYFVTAKQNPKIPEHANGPIEKLIRREAVAGRLSGKLLTLADVVAKAVQADCVTLAARSQGLERFKENNFKIAARQVLKNYLRLRENLSTESKKCKKYVNKITRKVQRYDRNLRNKYCSKVYSEEWCHKEYEYTLDDRVTNKNPHNPLKQ
jgi:hypothetical protein